MRKTILTCDVCGKSEVDEGWGKEKINEVSLYRDFKKVDLCEVCEAKYDVHKSQITNDSYYAMDRIFNDAMKSS